MEPNRKFQADTEPDIRPDLRVIPGGGETTPGRGNLSAVPNDPAEELSNIEQRGTAGDLPSNVTPIGINRRESEGDKVAADDDTSIKSTFTGVKNKAKVRVKAWYKRTGPLLGITGTVFGGGLIFVMLTSPSLLIVHMKEMFTEKFNTQLSSMDVRTTRMNMTKVNNTTKGLCAGGLTIKCRFSTMSEKQVKNFKAAGIEVVADGETITGRTKPASYIFKEQNITAADFSRLYSTDSEFRSAIKKAYNPKFAGFQGRAWSVVANLYGLSKKSPDLSGDTKEEKQKKLNAIAIEGMDDSGGSPIKEGDKKPGCDSGGKECTYTADEAKTANEEAGKIASELGEEGKSGKAGENVKSVLASAKIKSVTAGISILGVVEGTCAGIGLLNATSYASKTLKVVQLARSFMVLAVIADSIKAGDSPAPDQVSFLGDLLTDVTKDAEGNVVTASSTDSYGWKYAAYGDAVGSDQSMSEASRFVAGGALIGGLSAVSKTLTDSLGGREASRNTCGVLANPVVQGASLLAGIAVLFIPGANVGVGLIKIGASVVAGIAVGAVISMLPSMIADIQAGTITQNIAGADLGNAMTAGGGAIMSNTLAGQNGNGLLTKEDAIAYSSTVKNTSSSYIADELDQANPLDASNPHTFLGSIASSLLPLRSESNPLSVVGSLVATSVSKIIPKTSALTDEQYAKSLEVCQDQDALDAGYAVDPFCNPIRGIPPKYLSDNNPYYDTLTVLDRLTESGNLSEAGNPIGEYKTFIEKCITSTEPPGYQEGTDYNVMLAKDCFVNDDTADYYLHYIDRRIEEGMGGETFDDEPIEEAGGTLVGRPDGAIDKNRGWTIANGVDYSKYPCDPRTVDAGVYTSATYRFTVRLCTITWNTGSDDRNGTNSVNSVVSTNVMNMFEAARADGVELGLSDGMRKVGPSGYYSEHVTGLAMDIGSPRGGSTICFGGSTTSGYGSKEAAENACRARGGQHYAAYQWLNANAAKYGYLNYEVEPWHWSTSGS